jgi:hypothetical protein
LVAAFSKVPAEQGTQAPADVVVMEPAEHAWHAEPAADEKPAAHG